MARYATTFLSKTLANLADATNSTDNNYCGFLQSATASMRLKIDEVYIAGESASSNPCAMVLGRDSTLAATPSGNTNAPLDVQTVAPGTVAIYGGASTTKFQRSASLHLLHPSLNAYGGIARWQARQGEEITVFGTAVNVAEVSLSAVTGTGVVSGHILYELC
jgi:hypothetical protein